MEQGGQQDAMVAVADADVEVHAGTGTSLEDRHSPMDRGHHGRYRLGRG
jgi:hypothetical protein